MAKDSDEIVTPGAAALIHSMRAFGYSVETSVADLLDNSITAGAKNIDVHFHWDGEDSYVTILDDAAGMDEPTLTNAMRLGGTSPLETRAANDLGRFGLGLKTASFSQAKMLTVATKQRKKEQVNLRQWDIDHVQKTNEWSLQKGIDSKTELLLQQTLIRSAGTLVIWQKLDRLVGAISAEDDNAKDVFYGTATRVRLHLEMVFHRFLANGLKIRVNDNPCEPWDPFLQNHKNTEQLADESKDLGDAGILKIKAFVLPHNRYLTQETHQAAAGPKGWNLQQGFYLYRAGRLIVSGGDWWHTDLKPEEHTKLGRVQVEITQEMDSDWDLDVRKARARPPTLLRHEFGRIARATRAEAQKVYRALGKQASKKNPGPSTTIWQQTVADGAYRYKINRKHPVIKGALESARKGHSGSVRAALSLAEDHLPIGLIVEKFFSNEKEASEASMQKAPEKLTPELREQIQWIFDGLLQNGLTEEQARASIMEHEPFNDMPEEIGALERSEN